jgi:flagellar protein FlaG
MSEAVAELSPLTSTPPQRGTTRVEEAAPLAPPEATAQEQPTEAQQPSEPVDTAELVSRLDQLNRSGELQNVRFEYEVTDGGSVVIKVKDAKTDKVIREIPPEEQQQFSRKLRDYLGLLFDERA